MATDYWGQLTKKVDELRQSPIGQAVTTINPIAAYVPFQLARQDQERRAEAADANKPPYDFMTDFQRGLDIGQKEFYEDPDMAAARARQEDLAKGYSGEELGALRGLARGEISGERSKYLQQLQGNLARRGVGGARAAAVQAAANKGYMQQVGDAERKMALDAAQLKRQGTQSLEDFLFKQKYGKAAYGAGMAQTGVARETAQTAREANKEKKPGIIGSFFDTLF